MNLTLITDATPAQEPFQVADAEEYLIADSGSVNADLQTMITAARLEAEKENGRELAQKKWMLALDGFPRGYFWTQFGLTPPQYNERPYSFYFSSDSSIGLLDPLVSVDSFTYKKSDGTTVTLVEDTDFVVDIAKHPGEIHPAPGARWPADDLWPSSAVQITFTTGMTPDQVPVSIKQGMLLLISEWYGNRLPFSAVRFIAQMPFSVTSLFQNDKLWKF